MLELNQFDFWIWDLKLFSVFWKWELKIDFWIACEILIFVLELWVWKITWIEVFVVLIWTTMVWYDEQRFVIPFAEQRAGGLLRMLTYSVSRYWCNGIRSFQNGTMGMFLVSVRILYHPAVLTVLLYFFIFRSLALRDDVIYMYHFCVLRLECPFWTYPGTAQNQGYTRQYIWRKNLYAQTSLAPSSLNVRLHSSNPQHPEPTEST